MTDDDLNAKQKNQLREDIYHQLALLSLLHGREGFMLMTPKDAAASIVALFGMKENRPAAEAFKRAMAAVRQARALEKAANIRPTTTGR